jgi:hypothetical protein
MRDLRARAARAAHGTINNGTLLPQAMASHRDVVKQMLQDFIDGSEYLQAQITMVESAFKDRPELAQRLVQCINRAYTELCADTFGTTPR